MQRRRSFVESGAFVIASSLILLNNPAVRVARGSMAGHHRGYARTKEIARARARAHGPPPWLAESVNPLMTRTDAHSDLLSPGYCSIIRCAFYILHTSYASATPEISAALRKRISFQIKTSNTQASASNISSIIQNGHLPVKASNKNIPFSLPSSLCPSTSLSLSLSLSLPSIRIMSLFRASSES